MTKPDLLRVIKEGAEKAPSVMPGPDSDWLPVLMYEDHAGLCHTAGVPGMTPETVAACAEVIKSVLLKANAVQAVLVLPTYFSEITGLGVTKAERILVTHVTRDHTHCEAALVLRSKTAPPKLGAWDRVADDMEVGAGVFVDAMRAAIA
jgi:hypothetical protein